MFSPPFDSSAAAMVEYTHIHMKLFPVTGWGAKRVYSCCRWIWRKPLKGRNKPSFFTGGYTMNIKEALIKSLSDFILVFLFNARNKSTRIASYLRRLMT